MWLENRWVYLSLVLSLVVPGFDPYEFAEEQEGEAQDPGELTDWEAAELELLIQEGRRQLDRQAANLDRLRGRAQWLFTVGLALLGVLVGRVGGPVTISVSVEGIMYAIGLFAAVYAILGAAAILVVPARAGVIDARDLGDTKRQSEGSGLFPTVASLYPRAVAPGYTTWVNRLTAFFEAAVWIIIASGCAGVLYMWF